MEEIKNKDLYVSFETAMILKEIGFPQWCNDEEDIEIRHWYCKDKKIDTNLIDEALCSCPDIYQVQQWFRYYKNLSIMVTEFPTEDDILYTSYIICLYQSQKYVTENGLWLKRKCDSWHSDTCDKYENALKAAIGILAGWIKEMQAISEKKNENADLKASITENLMKLPKQERIELLKELQEKSNTSFDDPVLNMNIKEFAMQIKVCDENITCIPVGIYTWIGKRVDFDAEPDLVIEGAIEMMEKYHVNNLYTNYVCPVFTDSMTKGTWELICSLWIELIKEADLSNGNRYTAGTVMKCRDWLLIYDIEQEKYVTLEEPITYWK